MKKLVVILILNLAFFNILQAKENYHVVGYLPSWVNWELKDVDASKLTTVQFSFLEIENGEVIFGKNSSRYTFEENLIKLQYLKQENPNLKLTISVGGWGIGGFSEAAASEEGRFTLTHSIARFLDQYNFDGVDIDWEFPMHGGWGAISSSPQDKENFVLLVEEMRNQLDLLEQKNKKDYSLSVAVGVGPWVTRGVDFKAMELNVDHFGVMSYNLSGTWSKQTESHVNLYKGQSEWSTNDAVEKILETGINPNLLVLGVAFYGRPMGAVQGDSKNGLYQSFSGNGGKNSATYKYIQENYLGQKDYKVFFDKATKSTHIYNEKEGLFVSYHDPKSIKELVRYVKKNNLAGVLIWEITQDDKNKTLLKSINKYIN